MPTITRGGKRHFEARLLGCLFQTDDQKSMDILEATITREARDYIEPIAQAALQGVRELNAKAIPATIIKYFNGKVTVHSGKQFGEVHSEAYEVVHLPTKTDLPGE